MPDFRQLPYLLSLLEDDSVDVREAVVRELASYGAELELHLARIIPPLDEHHRLLIDGFIREGRRRRLRDAWESLSRMTEDIPLLESGLRAIAEFLQMPPLPVSLSSLLDSLAETFRASEGQHDALALAEFLFQREGLTGARESYYSAQNSNLLHVLTAKTGLPITLSCVYILVGDRCGLPIRGCNLPGHFLALAPHQGRKFVVDCFNGGLVLLDSDLSRLGTAAHVSTADLVGLECGSGVILSRVLRNLSNAFRRREDADATNDAELVESLRMMRADDEKS
jgi:hypothetical protein